MGADVLHPIGSLVKVTPNNGEQTLYIIIGKRVINHDNLKAWDYISIPYHDGFTRVIDRDMNRYENFFYFNHYEIEETISIFSLKTSEAEDDVETEEE